MRAYSTEPPDSPDDHEPDTLATPQGDNETLPEQPLSPPEPQPERPRGNEPHSKEPLYPALD